MHIVGVVGHILVGALHVLALAKGKGHGACDAPGGGARQARLTRLGRPEVGLFVRAGRGRKSGWSHDAGITEALAPKPKRLSGLTGLPPASGSTGQGHPPHPDPPTHHTTALQSPTPTPSWPTCTRLIR